jgi:MFS family permease
LNRTEIEMTDASAKTNPLFRVMALSDFRLLFCGATLSLLGNQFSLIATPWLVLQLTGDPMGLGFVLALQGLPRAAFMLIGGVITDRLSPRKIMLIADAVRLVLTALMAITVFTNTVDMWMIYAFSLGFGLVAGLSIPAENSIVPMLVGKDDLQAGNSLVMGVTQLAGFVGPSLAGIVIGVNGNSLAGIAHAYALDAVSFAVSAICLLLIRSGSCTDEDKSQQTPEGVLASIRTAFAHVWNDDALRLVFLLLAAINFLLIGPLLVGIPLVAERRLPEGAVAFGILMSAFSAGNLAGFVAAGALPRPKAGVVRAILVALLIGFSAVVGSLGLITSTALDFVLLLLLGLGNGYLAILLFTWMQNRTPKEMLGRVMSFLMLANTGLVPLSQAISGVAGKWNLDAMFTTAGALALLVALWAWSRSELKIFSHNLAAQSASAR